VKGRRAPLALQSRLLLLILSLLLLIWGGAALMTWRNARSELYELLDGHLAQTAAMLAVQADSDDDAVTDAPSLRKYAPQVAFQVFIGGKLVTRSADAAWTPMGALREGFSTVRLDDGMEWRVFAARDAKRDALALVAERAVSRRDILLAVMGSMVLPFLVSLPLFALAVWWSVRRGLAPLHALCDDISARAPDCADPVAQTELPRELLPLARTLNSLLERIAHMLATERRFTADAAHEMRTPLAGIRAQAQVALQAGPDAAQREHALELALMGCDRLTRLVQQLLTLARLDAVAGVAGQRLDLGALARTVAADLANSALERGQTLEVRAEPHCLCNADEILAGVLVRNLLDNALRYSPRGAHVLVTVTAGKEAGAGSVLRVQDTGPGMDEAAIAQLGNRFFRVLGSDETGSGLGWSIVHRLLEVFAARVQVGPSAELGGLCVTVQWPVAP